MEYIRYLFISQKNVPIRRICLKIFLFKLKVIIGTALFPIFLVLHFFNYRNVNIATDRIGHLVGESDAFLKERKLLGTKNKCILLAPKNKQSNKHFFRYLEEHFILIENPVLCFLLGSASLYGIMSINVSKYFRMLHRPQHAYKVFSAWEKAEMSPIFELSESDEVYFEFLANQLGIPKNAWFVCAHARTSIFDADREYIHGHRNVDIHKMQDAFLEISKAGGWIILMGNSDIIEFPLMKNVVNYTASNYCSDRGDIILSAKAKFFLGCSSGLCLVASAFGVPLAMTNMTPQASLGFSKRDLAIHKLHFDKRRGKLLGVEEIMKRELASWQLKYLFDREGIVLIENFCKLLY